MTVQWNTDAGPTKYLRRMICLIHHVCKLLITKLNEKFFKTSASATPFGQKQSTWALSQGSIIIYSSPHATTTSDVILLLYAVFVDINSFLK